MFSSILLFLLLSLKYVPVTGLQDTPIQNSNQDPSNGAETSMASLGQYVLSLKGSTKGRTLLEGSSTDIIGPILRVTLSKYREDQDQDRCIQVVKITMNLMNPPKLLDSVEVSCSASPVATEDDNHQINIGGCIHVNGRRTAPLLAIYVMSSQTCVQRVYGDPVQGVFDSYRELELAADQCQEVIENRVPMKLLPSGLFELWKPKGPDKPEEQKKLPDEFLPTSGKVLSTASTSTAGKSLVEDSVIREVGPVLTVTMTNYQGQDGCVKLVSIVLNLMTPPLLLDTLEVSCSLPSRTEDSKRFFNVGNCVYICGKKTEPLLGVLVMNPYTCVQRVYGDPIDGPFRKFKEAKLNAVDCEKVLRNRIPLFFSADGPALWKPQDSRRPPKIVGPDTTPKHDVSLSNSKAGNQLPSSKVQQESKTTGQNSAVSTSDRDRPSTMLAAEFLPSNGKVLSLEGSASKRTQMEGSVVSVVGPVLTVTTTHYHDSQVEDGCVKLVDILLNVENPPHRLDTVEVSCSTPPPGTEDNQHFFNYGNCVYIYGKSDEPVFAVFVMDTCIQRVYWDPDKGVLRQTAEAKLNVEECEQVLRNRVPLMFLSSGAPYLWRPKNTSPTSVKPDTSDLNSRVEERLECVSPQPKTLPPELIPTNGKVLSLNSDVDAYTSRNEPLHVFEGREITVSMGKLYREEDCVQQLKISFSKKQLDSIIVTCDVAPQFPDDKVVLSIGNIVYINDGLPVWALYVMDKSQCVERVYTSSYGAVFPDKKDVPMDGEDCQRVITTGTPKSTKKGQEKPKVKITEDGQNLKPKPPPERSEDDIRDYRILQDEKAVVLNSNTYNFVKDVIKPDLIHGRVHEFVVQNYIRGNQCFSLVTIKMRSSQRVEDQVKISCDILPPTRVRRSGLIFGGIIFEDGPFEIVMVVSGGVCLRRSYWVTGTLVDKRDVILLQPECDKVTKRSKADRLSGNFPGLEPPDPRDAYVVEKEKVAVLNGNVVGFRQGGDKYFVSGRHFHFSLQPWLKRVAMDYACVKLVTIRNKQSPMDIIDHIKINCDYQNPIIRWGKRFHVGHVLFEDSDMTMVFVVSHGECVRRRYKVTDLSEDVIITDSNVAEPECERITGRSRAKRTSGVDPDTVYPAYSEYRVVQEKRVVVLSNNVKGFSAAVKSVEVMGRKFRGKATKMKGRYNQCVTLVTFSQKNIDVVYDEVKISCDTDVLLNIEGSLKIGEVIFEESGDQLVFVVEGGSCIRRHYQLFGIDVAKREETLSDWECRRIARRSKEDRANGVFPDKSLPSVEDYDVVQSQKVVVFSSKVTGYLPRTKHLVIRTRSFIMKIQDYLKCSEVKKNDNSDQTKAVNSLTIKNDNCLQNMADPNSLQENTCMEEQHCIKEQECVKLVVLKREGDNELFDTIKTSCEVIGPQVDDEQDIELNYGNVVFVLNATRILYVVKEGVCVMRTYYESNGHVRSVDRVLREKECYSITRMKKEDRRGKGKLNKTPPPAVEIPGLMQFLSFETSRPENHIPLTSVSILSDVSPYSIRIQDFYDEQCVRRGKIYWNEVQLDIVRLSCGPVLGIDHTPTTLQYRRAFALQLQGEKVLAMFNSGGENCILRTYIVAKKCSRTFWDSPVTKYDIKTSDIPCQRLKSGKINIWRPPQDKDTTTGPKNL